VYSSSFEEMHANFVEVGDRTKNVGGDMAFIIKFFETTPDVDVLAFCGKGFLSIGVGIAIYPFFDIY
jgi:hypothetical protein